SVYYMEHRQYPGISTLFEDLVEGGVWSPRIDEKRIVDRWGRELVVRIPGTHEEIDIHSIGPDGIDQDGAGDDISSWAGVNEGHHYKQSWPLGRALLFNHAIFGLVFLAAARWLRWQVVLPIAGIIVSSGLMFGCWLLRHPGMMPDRNGPLEMVSYAAGIASLILAGFLVHFCRRESVVRRPSDL
ncbi:MAG TPA: type II secretion system protein GspG, partial [Bacteroidia bacterium]|nr:type II secretion system protein GspG [Bacteroidia bacterium]